MFQNRWCVCTTFNFIRFWKTNFLSVYKFPRILLILSLKYVSNFNSYFIHWNLYQKSSFLRPDFFIRETSWKITCTNQHFYLKFRCRTDFFTRVFLHNVANLKYLSLSRARLGLLTLPLKSLNSIIVSWRLFTFFCLLLLEVCTLCVVSKNPNYQGEFTITYFLKQTHFGHTLNELFFLYTL